MSRRGPDKLVADILDACRAAADLVARGRGAFDADRMLRLAAEAIVGRIGDAAGKLRDRVGADDLPGGIPWDDVIGNRIVVDHAYHRVDDVALWNTLAHDTPFLASTLEAWAAERDLQAGETGGAEEPPKPT